MTSSAPSGPACPLCGTEARQLARLDPATTVHRCAACALDFTVLSSVDESSAGRDHFQRLDLERYGRSVGAIRKQGARRLMERVLRYQTDGRWLDIGCSFGWLLRAAAEAGFTPFGIEPSLSALQSAKTRRAGIWAGRFPEAVSPTARFHVISFMDVLEHFPDPAAALREASRRLHPGGLLVVQVPDRSSFLYRWAVKLYSLSRYRLGFALRRLWLVGLDFPHRSYFSRRSLTAILENGGFSIVAFYSSALGNPLQSVDRVAYLSDDRRGGGFLVAAGVALIQVLDSLAGHGGLLMALARPAATAGGTSSRG